jgi:hypothetical protein
MHERSTNTMPVSTVRSCVDEDVERCFTKLWAAIDEQLESHVASMALTNPERLAG